MAYVKKVKRDNAQYDIKAVALDAQLDATLLHKSELENDFLQTEAGVNALDAAAGKTLNDSLSNTIESLSNIQGDVSSLQSDVESLGSLVVYRDLTIEPSTAITVPANGSIYFTDYTTPSVSGYTCIAVSVINQTGTTGGHCIFMPRLGTNGLTIHNNNSSAAGITRLQLRYVFLKN